MKKKPKQVNDGTRTLKANSNDDNEENENGRNTVDPDNNQP